MKLIATIIILTLAFLTVILSILNAETIQINYYFGLTEIALPTIVVVTLVVGTLLGIIASMSMVLKLKKHNAGLKKDIKLAEKEIANLRRLPLRDID